ncbi:hypothetical protein G6F59_017248 [Rhizopus arrhizus]|nr:hypothetical protein G6F59_017248 [Rhizopus arrhizus]
MDRATGWWAGRCHHARPTAGVVATAQSGRDPPGGCGRYDTAAGAARRRRVHDSGSAAPCSPARCPLHPPARRPACAGTHTTVRVLRVRTR